MYETYTIFTPLPQMKLHTELPDYNLGDGLSIRPLEQQLRNKLRKIAKEIKCSDDCMQLLLESELVFFAQVPTVAKNVNVAVMMGQIYSTIANEILKRVFRSLLMLQWVPAPLLIYCWFHAAGSADNIKMETLKILNPRWECIDSFTNIDWRSGEVEPEEITLGFMFLKKYWNKISDFCQIEFLRNIITDKKKEKDIFASANKYVVQKVEELMKAKYGPDTFIVNDDSDANFEKKSKDDDLPILPAPSTSMQNRFFIRGLNAAYLKEIDKLSQELYKRVFNKRFDRAFQFFTEAFRLAEPHRFIGFTTCLESFFCTSRNEITFQLASRVAWFLSPDDYGERRKIFTMVKSLYKLRSEIVHGVKYSHDKVEKNESKLITLIRRTFQKLLSDDCIYYIFRNKNQKVCSEYLEALNLGKTDPEIRRSE